MKHFVGEDVPVIGVQCVLKGIQNTVFGCSCVDGNYGGCSGSHPDCQVSVTKETMDSVNEERVSLEMVEFADHQMPLNCIGGGAIS